MTRVVIGGLCEIGLKPGEVVILRGRADSGVDILPQKPEPELTPGTPKSDRAEVARRWADQISAMDATLRAAMRKLEEPNLGCMPADTAAAAVKALLLGEVDDWPSDAGPVPFSLAMAKRSQESDDAALLNLTLRASAAQKVIGALIGRLVGLARPKERLR